MVQPSTPVPRASTYATANGTNDSRNGKLFLAIKDEVVSSTAYPVAEIGGCTGLAAHAGAGEGARLPPERGAPRACCAVQEGLAWQ
jgi:hypothetical protein